MTHPLPDYRRPAPPSHPGDVAGGEDWRRVADLVRTVLALLLGTAAALSLAAAVVLALGAVHVISPEQPARIVPVLLSAPDVRSDVARDWADEIETDRGVRFTGAERAEVVAALDDVLASDELHRQLRELRPADGRLDLDALAVTLTDELRAQAADRSPTVRQTLREAADSILLELRRDAASADTGELVTGLSNLRRVALVAAAVVAVPGLLAAAIALVVARRRPLTAVLISSGTLLLTAVALAPGRFLLERLPGALSLPGHLLAGIGQLAGPGTVWAIMLAAAVPPGWWWALRSLRSARATPTT